MTGQTKGLPLNHVKYPSDTPLPSRTRMPATVYRPSSTKGPLAANQIIQTCTVRKPTTTNHHSGGRGRMPVDREFRDGAVPPVTAAFAETSLSVNWQSTGPH